MRPRGYFETTCTMELAVVNAGPDLSIVSIRTVGTTRTCESALRQVFACR
jgi:hypothetical protein